MRLRKEERDAIVRDVRLLDPDAYVYLFGFRVDDNAKGGDIDLLVFSKKLTWADKLQLKKRIFSFVEEQKIDIVLTRDGQEPFVKRVFPRSEQLL